MPKASRNQETALNAFLQKKAEIDETLSRLQGLSGDHFGYDPEEIHWGHVGTLAHYAELLKRITGMAFHEGDHVA